MAVVSGQTKRFTAASPVTEYWLANCTGFSLTGGARGVVERVLPEGDPYTASSLEVRSRGKVRRVPASAVVEVIPAEQVLVVKGSDRGPARRAAVGRGTTVLGHVAVGVGVLLVGLATWLVRAGKETTRLVRSLPWQQYGRSVHSATTRLWQEISVTWWRLRTTSSAASSAKSSSKRARTTSST